MAKAQSHTTTYHARIQNTFNDSKDESENMIKNKMPPQSKVTGVYMHPIQKITNSKNNRRSILINKRLRKNIKRRTANTHYSNYKQD